MRLNLLRTGACSALAFCLSCASVPSTTNESPASPEASLSEATAAYEQRSGLLDVYMDLDGGRVLLGLPAPDATGLVGSYLYIEGLTTGLGSNGYDHVTDAVPAPTTSAGCSI